MSPCSLYPPTLLLQSALEWRGEKEAEAEKGLEYTLEKHIRDSA